MASAAPPAAEAEAEAERANGTAGMRAKASQKEQDGLVQDAQAALEAVEDTLAKNDRLIMEIERGQQSHDPTLLKANDTLLRELNGNLETIVGEYRTLCERFDEATVPEPPPPTAKAGTSAEAA